MYSYILERIVNLRFVSSREKRKKTMTSQSGGGKHWAGLLTTSWINNYLDIFRFPLQQQTLTWFPHTTNTTTTLQHYHNIKTPQHHHNITTHIHSTTKPHNSVIHRFDMTCLAGCTAGASQQLHLRSLSHQTRSRNVPGHLSKGNIYSLRPPKRRRLERFWK